MNIWFRQSALLMVSVRSYLTPGLTSSLTSPRQVRNPQDHRWLVKVNLGVFWSTILYSRLMLRCVSCWCEALMGTLCSSSWSLLTAILHNLLPLFNFWYCLTFEPYEIWNIAVHTTVYLAIKITCDRILSRSNACLYQRWEDRDWMILMSPSSWACHLARRMTFSRWPEVCTTYWLHQWSTNSSNLVYFVTE